MHRNAVHPSVIDEVAEAFCRVRDEQDMKVLLAELLTPTELSNLALRWQAMKLLAEKTPQRQIAARLGISLCKVTRGARVLKDTSSISKRLLRGEGL